MDRDSEDLSWQANCVGFFAALIGLTILLTYISAWLWASFEIAPGVNSYLKSLNFHVE